MPDHDRLITRHHGRVLTVQFNNPPRNFYDEQMSIELDLLTRRIKRDQSIGAIVFTGQGSTYMTHFDVTDLLHGSRSVPFGMPYSAARIAAAAAHGLGKHGLVDRALRRTTARDMLLMARTYAALERLNRMNKVVVTAINGLAFGMGCVFALACDIRVMADGFDIGLTESNLDMLGAAGGTQRLVRMIGASRAMQLLLDGQQLSAREAQSLGLVHDVVAAGELDDRAHAIAQRLSRRSPVINREIKRMVYDAGSRPFTTAVRREAASLIATLTSAQAERTMDNYLHTLRSHDPLTDTHIKESLSALHNSGVPGGPYRYPTRLPQGTR